MRRPPWLAILHDEMMMIMKLTSGESCKNLPPHIEWINNRKIKEEGKDGGMVGHVDER